MGVRTARVIPQQAVVITALGSAVLGRKVHQLYQGAPDVDGNVADEPRVLVRQHNAGGVPPLAQICMRIKPRRMSCQLLLASWTARTL